MFRWGSRRRNTSRGRPKLVPPTTRISTPDAIEGGSEISFNLNPISSCRILPAIQNRVLVSQQLTQLLDPHSEKIHRFLDWTGCLHINAGIPECIDRELSSARFEEAQVGLNFRGPAVQHSICER